MSERVNPDLSKFEMRRLRPQVEEIVDLAIATLRQIDPPKSATVNVDYSKVDEGTLTFDISGKSDDPEFMAWHAKVESEKKDARIQELEDEANELRAKLRSALETLLVEQDTMSLGPSEMVNKAKGVFMAVERIKRDVLGR